MSINVHFKGNPIIVKSGGMVVTNSQEEFNKKRKIRLEQVRQQSRDIATTVRNRIAKVNKQVFPSENVEKQDPTKPQTQKKCNEYMPLPAQKTLEVHNEEELIASRIKENRAKAKERGEKANQKLQAEKNEKSMQKSVPFQHKRISRDIENRRSLAISSICKRKRGITDKKSEKEIRNVYYLNSSTASETNSSVGRKSPHQEYDTDEKCDCPLSSGSSLSETPSKKLKRKAKHKMRFQSRVSKKVKVPQRKRLVEVKSKREIPKAEKMQLEKIDEKKEVDTLRKENEESPIKHQQKPQQKLLTHSVNLPTCSQKPPPKIKSFEQKKPEFKRIPLRSKLFTQHDDTKTSVENVSNKVRPEGFFKYQNLVPSSPERPRSPIVMRAEIRSEPNQEFVVNRRISEHICSRILSNNEKTKDCNIQVKCDKDVADACVQSDLKADSLQACNCTCFGGNLSRPYSICTCCTCPETTNEETQTDTALSNKKGPSIPSSRCISSKSIQVKEDGKNVCENCKRSMNLTKCASATTESEFFNEPKSRSGKSVCLPMKPSITFTSSSKSTNKPCKPTTVQRVQHYDDITKYSKSYVPPCNLVQKISDENLSIVIETDEDEKMQERKAKHDTCAEIRGQTALRKEKICRDYEEIMKKLPILQKKERISQIGKDDPKTHMSEERRKEYEKKKENKIENAYENYFPKPVTITIPKKTPAPEIEKVPFKVIDMSKEAGSVELGTWDVNFTEKSTCSKSSKVTTEESEHVLKNLLEKLIDQKEKLDQEVCNIPEGSKLSQILQELEKDLPDNRKKPKESISTSEKRSKSPKGCKLITQTTPISPEKTKGTVQECNLQSASTQTSPRSENVLESRRSCSCSCKLVDSCEKLCQIVIKVGDEANQPEIHINPAPNEENEIVVKMKDLTDGQKSQESGKVPRIEKKPEEPSPKALQKTGKQLPCIAKSKPERPPPATETPRNKDETWKDILNQNSTNGTSSTSYMSPPNYSSTCQPKNSNKKDNLKTSILFAKPQQGNLSYKPWKCGETAQQKPSNPELLNHIKTLLKKTHRSIDELNVSSVSSISTPECTLMLNEDNNKTISQLKTICKQYNLRKKDLEKMLNVLSSSSSNGACESTSTPSYKSASIICPNQESPVEEQKKSPKEKSLCGQIPPEPLQKLYEEMTSKCIEKIESLSTLIQKLRDEKSKIVYEPSNNSDKENSTKYLELSPDDGQKCREVESSDSSSCEGQDTLTRKLLEIDEALTERIKNLNKSESPEDRCKVDINSDEAENSIEKELITRYRNLVCQNHDKHKDKKSCQTEAHFVPFISDLRSLPKWEGLGEFVPPIDNDSNKYSVKQQNKPPTSRGLLIAKRFNEDINNYPHELSSITEVDSFTSSKIRKSLSPPRRMSPKVEQSRGRQSPPSLDVGDFPQLNTNFGVLKIERKQNIVLSPELNKELQLVLHHPKIASSSPTRNVRSEQSSPKKKTPPTPPELYKKGGEVLKRARELTQRIQNLSKSFEASGSPPCSNHEELLRATEDLIEEVRSKQKDRPIKEENSKSSNESSTDVESVEKMLKSLGMGWAITTLRKTQQALAMTSSSSSLDLKVGGREIKITEKSSSSEISLVEYLEPKNVNDFDGNNEIMMGKIFQNISSILASSSTLGKTTQRTSTPVNNVNDTVTPRSHIIYSGESDLSSVRHSSEYKSSSFKTSGASDRR